MKEMVLSAFPESIGTTLLDGTGYPDRLKGRQIPVGARVVAAAEAFTAVASDRPHRPKLDGKEACVWIRVGRVVDARSGDTVGTECFFDLMNWDDARFVIRHGESSSQETMDEDAIGLLMEHFRRFDELNASLNAFIGESSELVEHEPR